MRRRTPQRDLEDFEAGQTIQVLCLVWTLGGSRRHDLNGHKLVPAKPGHLYLTKGQPVPLPQLGDRFDDQTWREAAASER